MSGEKKRLEQDILQRRASTVVLDPRFGRFQQAADPIDSIRLRQAQQLAGQVPLSERLKKQVKKTRKKTRKTKALRGDLSQNLTAQRRFTRGERREKDTEEPRIVGEAAPVPAGFAYDPGIERRRLDIEEARNRDANLRALADRRDRERAQERELAVRRGELAAARADRALERARIAAIPPPAPIVIPPAAPAPPPVINIAPAPVRVDVAAPVVNVPAPLPARADADPIPEIQRLGAEIRADTNAYGQEQEERNRDFFRQLREAAEFEGRQTRETLEAVEARQQAQDENTRVALARQDALNEELQVRLGMHEVEMGRARDAVIQEIRDAEGRLGVAREQLDQPSGYDDVILAAERPSPTRSEIGQTVRSILQPPEVPVRVDVEEVDSPTPERREPEPEEPGGIGGVIAGGGELNLPNVVVEQPGRIGPDESLRLSPVPSRGSSSGGSTERQLDEILEADDPERAAEFLRQRQERFQQEQEELQFPLQLDPVEPVNVAEALRLSRLAIDEAEPVLQEEEEDEAQQARLRLVDTQDFLAGFDRPASPLVGGGTAAERLEELLAQPSPTSPRPTPTPRPEDETPEQALAIFQEAQQLRQGGEEEEPRPGQVAEGIEQFGGAAGPAPPAQQRVIEDAGIQAQPALRPLDPDVLFEPVEEAEEVGQVQDTRPQAIRDSYSLYQETVSDLAANVRRGPQGSRGQRGGVGYRIRNNTDKKLKKVEPGDVVNISGVDAGADGRGRYRLDTETATGTRVGLDQLSPLVQSGDLLFERGHRHELGGHFDEQPYGPPPQEPGLLQQGAEAAGGAAAAVVGGAGRLAGGLALGAAQGVAEQLPSAGDVGAALGRGAVGVVAGAGRLAAGAVGAVVGGGEEEEEEEP